MFVLLAELSIAQSIEFNKENFDNKKGLKDALYAKKEGDFFFSEGKNSFYYALPEYLKAQEFNPNNAELNYRIGVCYLYTIFKTRAEDYLQKAFELDSAIAPDIYFQLAHASHVNEHWDKAKDFYKKQKFVQTSLLNIDSELQQKRIKECETGKDYSKKPLNVKISNIGETVNTQFPEYLVVINADETVMMYTSQRPGSTGETVDEAHDDFSVHNEDIYYSEHINNKWSKSKNVGHPVNTKLNDATIALAPDGHTLLTYNDLTGGGDIYECKLHGTEWSTPYKMSSNINSPYHESSASFSFDAKSLYFVSNRPDDNIGDHDIYVSHWNDSLKQWGPAQNLGPKINTKYSEQGVFAHPDGNALYFSSKGHETMGGFDIFKSEWDESTESWGTPKNLGYPINGPENDVGFVMSASGKHAYMSAYHSDSKGKEDIYRIDFPEGSIEHLTLLKGNIYDKDTKKPVHATIKIIDLQKHKEIAEFESNSATGHYLISLPAGKNYAIEIESKDHLFQSANVNIPKTDGYHEVKKDIYLDKIEVGKKMVLNNIFFDYNKSSLRPESEDELRIVKKFMTQNPTLKVEISGHTDNRGSHEYNMKLSEDRAHVVVDDLVAHGISKDRLIFKGYGEEQPIAPNDTEANMQLNRRTELKIISK